jgi:hypothetical protein
MDERRSRTSIATASSDTELANAAVPHSDHPIHQPVTVDSTVVYCGDPEKRPRRVLAGAEPDAGER